MIAGIITTPDRQQYLPPLVALISPYVDKLFVYNDLLKVGNTYNLKRCMTEVLSVAKRNEPVLIMTDDVTTVDGWFYRLMTLHSKLNQNIYTLFTRQRHMAKYSDVGYAVGVHKKGFYDQAVMYVNQADLTTRIDDWFQETGQHTIPKLRQNHYDVIIQEYLVQNDIPWVVTIPTLFDHIGVKSSLGHDIGSSIDYIGG